MNEFAEKMKRSYKFYLSFFLFFFLFLGPILKQIYNVFDCFAVHTYICQLLRDHCGLMRKIMIKIVGFHGGEGFQLMPPFFLF